jgi:hypothetical protein
VIEGRELPLSVTIWLLCVLAGLVIGEKKNRPLLGLCLGLIFGIFGVAFLALLPTKSAADQALGGKKATSLTEMWPFRKF